MIRFINIRHFAGDRELFNGLDWHVKPGERVGLVGDNGTGKTTLLRMASGEVEPTEGVVQPRRNMRLGFLKQEIHAAEGDGTVLHEAMKAFEEEQQAQEEIHNLYDKMAITPESEHEEIFDRIHALERAVYHHDAGSAESDAKKILVGLGFRQEDLEKPLAEFSGGWQMRAHIARLLLERPDLLMLDEPTNHLDLESIEWLEKFLQSFPGALIVVSHDRYFLDRITTRTAWLSQKKLRSFTGNYSKFLTMRDEEEDLIRRQYENQQEEIAHVQQFIDRFRAKASKATMVQSRVKMLEKLERIELPQSSRKVRIRMPAPREIPRQLLELRNIRKNYDDKKVLLGVNLLVEQGDKIALVGRNGAGKSTLLKISAGVLDYEGERLVHPKVQLEYFSQHRVDQLDPDNTMLEEARAPGANQTDEQLRALLGCFLFTGDDVFKKVGVLSGGEKSRVALARMMLRRGNLLLLDEPTNHLDINTRDVLRDALHDFPGTIMMISHDRYFIDAVANKIVEVANGNITVYHGNYAEYLAKKQSTDAEIELRGRGGVSDNAPLKPAENNSAINGALAAIQLTNHSRRDEKRNSGEERRERSQKRQQLKSQVGKLEQQIQKMEARLAEIHAIQAEPASYSNGRATPELAAEGKSLEQKLPALLKEWEALADQFQELNAAAM